MFKAKLAMTCVTLLGFDGHGSMKTVYGDEKQVSSF